MINCLKFTANYRYIIVLRQHGRLLHLPFCITDLERPIYHSRHVASSHQKQLRYCWPVPAEKPADRRRWLSYWPASPDVGPALRQREIRSEWLTGCFICDWQSIAQRRNITTARALCLYVYVRPGDINFAISQRSHSAVQSKKAVTAYFSSERLLPFDITPEWETVAKSQ